MPVGRDRVFRLDQESPSSHRVIPKTAAYQMVPRDTLVKTDPTAGGFTVTLPPVVECAGGIYVLKQIASANSATVVDKGDANVAVSIALNAATETLILFSDGEQWYTIYNVTL